MGLSAYSRLCWTLWSCASSIGGSASRFTSLAAFGALWLAVGALSAAYMVYLKIFEHVSMILTPLPMLAAMSVMMGVMSICIGLVAEIVVRTYFESQGKTIYHARELINLDRPPLRRPG